MVQSLLLIKLLDVQQPELDFIYLINAVNTLSKGHKMPSDPSHYYYNVFLSLFILAVD